jgi:hypothetical protein
MTVNEMLRHAQNSEDYQDLYSGLIRIHILFHACEDPIFGLGMSDLLSEPRTHDGAPPFLSVWHSG